MVSSAQRVCRPMGDGGIAREAHEALADDRLWIGTTDGLIHYRPYEEGRQWFYREGERYLVEESFRFL